MNFTLPALETASDAKRAASAIVTAVATGELTPSEASDISTGASNGGRLLRTMS